MRVSVVIVAEIRWRHRPASRFCISDEIVCAFVIGRQHLLKEIPIVVVASAPGSHSTCVRVRVPRWCFHVFARVRCCDGGDHDNGGGGDQSAKHTHAFTHIFFCVVVIVRRRMHKYRGSYIISYISSVQFAVCVLTNYMCTYQIAPGKRVGKGK